MILCFIVLIKVVLSGFVFIVIVIYLIIEFVINNLENDFIINFEKMIILVIILFLMRGGFLINGIMDW